jgi:hypothetical protein
VDMSVTMFAVQEIINEAADLRLRFHCSVVEVFALLGSCVA